MTADTLNPALPADEPRAAISAHTRTALAVTAAALAAGVVADVVLREIPWGLNAALFVVAFCGLSAAIARRSGSGTTWRPWMAPVLMLGCFLAWRDSAALKALDLLALAVVLSLAALQARGTRLREMGVGAALVAVPIGGLHALFGGGLLAGETKWSEVPRRGASRHGLAVLRGLALSLPLLLLFGSLLTAADAGFERLVGSLIGWDLSTPLSHVGFAMLFAWMSAGAFQALHLPRTDRTFRPPTAPTGLALGATETTIVTGMLDLLFAAFVAVQVRWLFGGSALVASSPALGYAEYARRGFFELVAVAALVLPVLLALHWLQRGNAAGPRRLFRVLATVQVALLYVIMASALNRMWLYQQAYGLTELRVYTTAFMAWLAVVFAWFAATVLRDRRERFAFGAVAAAVATLAVLHAVDPDALIVRVNLARAAATGKFDGRYAGHLGGDAVPELVAGLPRLPPVERCAAGRALKAQWLPKTPEDWRAWSWGRSRALHAAASHEAELRTACAGVTMPERKVSDEYE